MTTVVQDTPIGLALSDTAIGSPPRGPRGTPESRRTPTAIEGPFPTSLRPDNDRYAGLDHRGSDPGDRQQWVASRRWATTDEFHRLNGGNRPRLVVRA